MAALLLLLLVVMLPHVAHVVYSNFMLHAIIQRNTFTCHSVGDGDCKCRCHCHSRRMMPIAASSRKRRAVRREDTHIHSHIHSHTRTLAHCNVQRLFYLNLIETFLAAARRQAIEVPAADAIIAIAAIDLPACPSWRFAPIALATTRRQRLRFQLPHRFRLRL